MTPNRVLLSTPRHPEAAFELVLNAALGTLQRHHLLMHLPGGHSSQVHEVPGFTLPLLPASAYPGRISILARATSREIYGSAQRLNAVQSLRKRWARSQRWVLTQAPAHATLLRHRFRQTSQSIPIDISRCHGS